MSQEIRRKVLSSQQRVLRISGFPQNEVRKNLLKLATVNVGSLSDRSKEVVVDMFKRRRVDIKCLQKVRYRSQGTRGYGGEEKYKFW